MSSEQAALLKDAERIMANADSAGTGLQRICDLIRSRIPGCDWVGFYIAVSTRDELALGPYSGEATEHLRIPFGHGVCGQAAATRATVVVDDVSTEENYLSCSPHVQSEVVIPVFHNGEIVGELDIDSHEIASFGRERRAFLEKIAGKLGEALASLMPA